MYSSATYYVRTNRKANCISLKMIFVLFSSCRCVCLSCLSSVGRYAAAVFSVVPPDADANHGNVKLNALAFRLEMCVNASIAVDWMNAIAPTRVTTNKCNWILILEMFAKSKMKLTILILIPCDEIDRKCLSETVPMRIDV